MSVWRVIVGTVAMVVLGVGAVEARNWQQMQQEQQRMQQQVPAATV